MMAYWMRIALGALLGLGSSAALWYFVGTPWITAAVGALLGAVGFLGSYFIWSADRLDEGYEQVLFDRPNTIVAGVLVVALAGVGMGSGLLGADPVAAAFLTPEQRVSGLYADYQKAADAYVRDEADANATLATVGELRIESDRIAIELEALPESPTREALIEANDDLALAMDALKACIGGEESQCVDARLMAADAKAALDRALPPPPVEDAEDEPAA